MSKPSVPSPLTAVLSPVANMHDPQLNVVVTQIEQQQQQQQQEVLTSGRPRWYNQDGRVKQAFLIGVAGGSASGKTSVTRRIIESLGIPWVVLLSMDSFYKDLAPADLEKAHKNDYNFDHPCKKNSHTAAF